MSSGLSVQAKHIAAGFLFHVGGVNLLRSWRRNRGVILAYHRVLPAGSDDLSFTQPGMYVMQETFETQIRYLTRHYRLVALDDLLARPFDRTCAITFDDGWLDNYEYAFPLLKKYGVPATIFIATGQVGTGRWPWPDRICYYIHNAPAGRFAEALASALPSNRANRDNGGGLPADRHLAAEQVVQRLKALEHDLLDQVMTQVDCDFADLNAKLHQKRPWMNWDEVVEMSAAGIVFGSHTRSHVILTRVSGAEARVEIQDSRLDLSARLDKPTTAFCYPNGAYDPELVRMVSDAGYSLAVTTKRGLIDHSANPMTLNRLMIHNDMTDTVPMLACTLSDAIPFF
jgi:peptidoglycan/xylan/chitin deacetylase (PgdA/CDA1 family)